MIITKTPLRVSFAGGGSDLAAYYRREPGAVLSTSIDKFIYICVNKSFDDRIRLSYSRTEEVSSVDDLEHPLVRAALRKLGIAGGIEIVSVADIPSRGSGLGSSSAFTVGLLHALHAYQGRYRSREQLACEACEVEIDICGEPIGKQDQYGAAMGGMNYIRFNSDDSVDVEPIIIPRAAKDQINASLMMFYTGVVRSASQILLQQSVGLESDDSKLRTTRRLADLAGELREELTHGRLDAIGRVMHEGWLLKRSLTDGISSDTFDSFYARAREAGALGGKLLGAGGGGFFVFYVPEASRDSVRAALSPLREIAVSLERQGSSVVVYQETGISP